MNERIRDFLRDRRRAGLADGPCLVVDLEVVRENYEKFARALPDTRVFYAVKANPEPKLLAMLAELGSCFDTASVAEIRMALEAGATPERISFGNTIKKERDIVRALELGVRLFAVDCEAEVEKIAAAKEATGAEDVRVFCRILCDGAGAEWPLSRKFGCEPEMAVDVLEHAHRLRSRRTVSRSRRLAAGEHGSVGRRACVGVLHLPRLRGARHPPRDGQSRRRVPDEVPEGRPAVEAYGNSIFQALSKHFGNRLPETIIEPGRGMVGNAGIIESEVVLVSKKSRDEDEVRWVYLDIGKFGGLAETMDESIRYRVRTEHDGDRKAPCVLAGPTCDSADVMYEKTPYLLPVSLAIGDLVLIEGTGAYTSTYSSVAFNGLPPLETHVI
jgi:ornithine decarboxylase